MQCNNGACISDARWCDAVDHCLDGTDEPQGGCPSCPPNQHMCESIDRCYYPSEICDGVLTCDGKFSSVVMVRALECICIMRMSDIT